MTESWTLVKTIVGHAMELQPEERAEYVQFACSVATQYDSTVDKDELEQEVNSLLSHISSESDNTEWTIFGHSTVDTSLVWIGRQLGSYKVIREIGAGGMGHVFEAIRNDGTYQTKVAIKVLRANINSPTSRMRFNEERQIVAALQHPGIARLLDGGTIEGLPYFVMEFVEGTPIDTYCGNNQIGIADRFSLFISVCEAVESAHTQLIVHQDIKPLNILVTPEGRPKLLDFGIATVLSKENERTANGAMKEKAPYTVTYVSPEQIEGHLITTATDVYALGMVLYRLLTGCLPYTAKPGDTEAWLNAVKSEYPRAPSEAVSMSDDIAATRRAGLPSGKILMTALNGDVTAILNKALAKRPADRYATVTEFRQDLERYLRGRPVQARRRSAIYAFRKFISRNRWTVSGALIAFVAIAIATGGVFWQAKIASMMESKARARASYIQDIAENMIFRYNDDIYMLPGGQQVSQRLMADIADFLDRMRLDDDVPSSVRLDLVKAYRKLARAQNAYRQITSDKADAATENLRRALDLIEKLYAGPSGEKNIFSNSSAAAEREFRTDILINYSGLLIELGDDAQRTADFNKAELRYLEAEQRADEALALSPKSNEAIILKSKSIAYSAQILAFFKTDYTRALEKLTKAKKISTDLLNSNPDLMEAHELLSNQLTAQGLYNQELGNWDASKRLFREALVHDRILVNYEQLNMLYAKTLASDLYRVASIDILIFNAPTSETEAMLNEAKKVLQPALRSLIPDLQALYVNGMINVCLSQQALQNREIQNAVETARDAIKVGDKLLEADSKSYDNIYFSSLARSQLATALSLSEPDLDAKRLFKDAFRPLESIAVKDPAMLKRLANLGRQHAATLINYGFVNRALYLLDNSLSLLESNHKDFKTRQYQRVYGGIQFQRGRALAKTAMASNGVIIKEKFDRSLIAMKASSDALTAASLLAPLAPNDQEILNQAKSFVSNPLLLLPPK